MKVSSVFNIFKFSTQNKPNGKSLLKGKHMYLVGTLSFGYGIYQKFIRGRMLKDNTILNDKQSDELLKQNFTSKDNQILYGHPLNLQYNHSQKKQRVVVIGAGIIGITQAYKLLEKGYEVVLLDQEKEPAKQTSYFNGCLFTTTSYSPFVTRVYIMYDQIISKQHYMWDFIKSIFQGESNVKLNLSVLFEKYIGIWVTNALLLSMKDQQELDNGKRVLELGDLSYKELTRMKQKSPELFSFQQTFSQGLLIFHNTDDQQKEFLEFTNHYNIKTHPINDANDLDQHNPTLKSEAQDHEFLQKYKGLLIQEDTNIDTREFCIHLLKFCRFNYKETFEELFKCQIKNFVFDDKGVVIGIMSNLGYSSNYIQYTRIIRADLFVISSGNFSKYLGTNLGVRLPILPVKGWVLGIERDQLPLTPSFFEHYNIKTPESYFTLINQEYRLSGIAEVGQTSPDDNWGAKRLIKSFNKILNSDINIENCKVNSCFRPVTPDGSPIIGRITGFPNIFVNAGHGTKGTTYSLGSATILADIIENGNEAEERWNQYGMSRFYLV